MQWVLQSRNNDCNCNCNSFLKWALCFWVPCAVPVTCAETSMPCATRAPANAARAMRKAD